MMMPLCCRDRLINTCTLSESKLHSCHEVHIADSDRLSLSQKLQLDPKMADYVTERRQSASYRKTEVCTQQSLDPGNILYSGPFLVKCYLQFGYIWRQTASIKFRSFTAFVTQNKCRIPGCLILFMKLLYLYLIYCMINYQNSCEKNLLWL